MLRLTEREKKHLSKQAKLAGMQTGPFIRGLIAGTDLKPKPPNEYQALLRELSALGNNLNQIARNSNSTKTVDALQIQQCQEIMSDVWHLVKDSL